MPSKIFLPDNPYWDWFDELFETEGTTFDWQRKRNFSRQHLVKIKIKEMGPKDVALCPGLPLPGSVYVSPIQSGLVQYPLEVDKFALLIRQKAKRRSNDGGQWEYWIVTSEYSTEIPSRNDPGDKPEQDLADISWDFENSQEAGMHDLAGSPYITTAFMPFLKAPIREIDFPVLSISRNELSYNFETASYYSRSLNDIAFLGVPRGCVQCLPPRANQKNTGILRYWRTSYKLRVRPMQFNRTTPTDPLDLYKLPPLHVILPRTAGDGGGGPVQNTNTGLGSGGAADAGRLGLGMVIGDLITYDSSDQVRYDAVPGTPLDYPSEAGVRIWDSWQPLVLMEGMYRIGRGIGGTGGSVPGDSPDRIGKPIPIYGPDNQKITHAVMLDNWGQRSKSPNEGSFPALPPIPWFKQFVNYRYTSLQTLLVQGLT